MGNAAWHTGSPSTDCSILGILAYPAGSSSAHPFGWGKCKRADPWLNVSALDAGHADTNCGFPPEAENSLDACDQIVARVLRTAISGASEGSGELFEKLYKPLTLRHRKHNCLPAPGQSPQIMPRSGAPAAGLCGASLLPLGLFRSWSLLRSRAHDALVCASRATWRGCRGAPEVRRTSPRHVPRRVSE